jgi:hypothetical protein
VESLVDAPHEKAQRRERWKANAVRVSDLCQLPSIDREMEAMSDAKLSSKTLSIPDGELWSLVRSLISQGTYIQMDATAGKYKHSEEFFARIDEAARERAEEILTKYSAPEPATEHPPQLMAVVDKWQDLANRWRELTPRRDREDAALVELILREIRETIAPSSSVTKEGGL